ncbi:peptidoglycan editing factor PgeF [Ornithinibacillus sp. L9]|uniref:Purine nucleoside phosphorylase n=1 Tax=Ornithinibacillus caprae TaxID=2678566 RepID=A0A6N8FIM7_9BACI|nr:peptidoglycan editing factor PgeF [Ornithinibacillus caprae]MUK89522.1 peptidoglycan editing factor PgeF [Ornithinibacillus caprae]
MAETFLPETESFLSIQKWQQKHPHLIAGFTTRNGGESKSPFDSLNLGLHVADDKERIISNRKILAEQLGFPLENWVSGEQVHHSNVHMVTLDDRGKGSTSYESSIQGTDGLITNESGVLCTAFFADCVPLYFYDPHTGYIGIAHAGWKGTVNRIAEKMVNKLQSIGVDVKNLLVAIGPCISQEKYEVNDHVLQHIDPVLRENTILQSGEGKFLLDLKQLNVEILLQCGVIRNNIDVTNYCTYTDQSLFFSHRRDQGKTGRMLGYIGYRRF